MKIKACLVLVIGLCIFAYAGLMGAAVADQINPDAKVLSKGPVVDSAAAGPTVKVTGSWLSPTQWGSTTIKTARPGEYIYGVFNITLSNVATTLDRYYAIDKYSFAQSFSGYYDTGTAQFSWGWQIPNDLAKGNDHPVFYFKITAEGGNTVIKKLSFTIHRDSICDSSRAYMEPMDQATKKVILANCKAVNADLKKSRLKFSGHYYPKSTSATAFLGNLKKYRPNAALIHSHGSSYNGGIIVLQDDTYVDATTLTASGFTAPAGLFYAAVCEGATAATLGNAFVAAGYDAFIGYTVSVFTVRNAAFYKYFFDLATKPDKTVASALSDTIVWANSQGWSDVATATIIGDGSALYLGGRTTIVLVEGNAMTKPPAAAQVAPWKIFAADRASVAERNAVGLADQVPEVKKLRAQYGSALKTGFESFPSVYRVGYKVKNIFVYGVDVDRATGSIVFHGTLD